MLGGVGLKVGVGKTVASRLATESLRGALVDFFQDPNSPNLSTQIMGNPQYANLFSAALAHDEDDNQWIRRLKNMIEGATIGLAVDGLQELYGGLRAGKKLLQQGKTPNEAAEATIRRVTDNTPDTPGSAARYAVPIIGDLTLIPSLSSDDLSTALFGGTTALVFICSIPFVAFETFIFV